MTGQSIIDFETITKYPLRNFLQDYSNFMTDNYQYIYKYFNGQTINIDNRHFSALMKITVDCKDVCAQFKNFANRLDNCGFWELYEYLTDLNDTIERVNKLPKFLRTALSKHGYKPCFEMKATVGNMKTMDDVGNSINSINGDETQDWVALMRSNDLNENDWAIDKMSNVNVYVNNRSKIVVESILDMPIGERVYGIDIDRKIAFENNDLKLMKYEDNIKQKCDILITLLRGDIPENLLLGVSPILLSSTIKNYGYAKISEEIVNTFMQNDLFDEVSVKDISFDNGSVNIKIDIKTKYEFSTEKTVTI